MNLDKKFYKRVALIVAGGILFAFALRNISVIWGGVTLLWGFVFPFILGLSMAFLLNIPMRAVEKHIFRGKNAQTGRKGASGASCEIPPSMV